jgi:hypothetical protein
MKGAKRDTSGIFDSLQVHYGGENASFAADSLKVGKSVITLPSAWNIEPFTEMQVQMEDPKARGAKIDCRGVVVECRRRKALKNSKKEQYEVSLLLIDLPSSKQRSLEKFSQKA